MGGSLATASARSSGSTSASSGDIVDIGNTLFCREAASPAGDSVLLCLVPRRGRRRGCDPRRDPADTAALGQPISSPSAGSSYSCLHSTHRTHSVGFAIESRVSSRAMPRLVDTTIRVLSQEPLAGLMPTADLLRLAELLDGAGFAYLEVSGGGVFDNAVRRGVESPWERIRALKARTSTPLALALRGRFLVGSRPVGRDFARRFVASAAQSGIDVFRLARPAERRRQPARGGRGDRRLGERVRGGAAVRQRPPRGARRRGEAPARARRGAAAPATTRPRSCSRTVRASSSPSCARSRGCRSGSTRRAQEGTRSQRRSKRRARAPTCSPRRSTRSR